MKKGWPAINLGDLCEVVGGGTPSKSNRDFYAGNIPWATVRDMRQDVIKETECRITKEAVKNSATNIIPAGNVVIATRVGLGKVCLIEQDTAINQDLRGIIPKDKKALSIRFLFWWLKTMAETIIAEGKGATVQGVKLPFVKSLKIPLPPLAEQQRIVGVLDKAFAELATAQANAEKNLQNARALFESHLQRVFTLDPAKMGKGWQFKRIDEVSLIKPPKSEVRSRLSGNALVSFLPMEDLGIASKYPEPKQTKPLSAVVGSYTYFGEGDVLLAKITPCFENGKLGIAKGLMNGIGFGSSEFIVLRPYKPVINEWLFYFLSRNDFRSEGAQRMGGAVGQQRVPKEFIESYTIPIPPLSEQQQIVKELDALSTETQRLDRIYEQKKSTLTELKKSLLHRAFNGDL